MARKTLDFEIKQEEGKEVNRDAGKRFRLTEMSAMKAEDWAKRAFGGMARTGIDIPMEVESMGLAGVAALGLRAFAAMDTNEMRPLMDEMITCAKIIPSDTRIQPRAITEDDIEEISTLVTLRKEIFELHTGFFARAARLKLERAAAEAAAKSTPDTSISPDPQPS